MKHRILLLISAAGACLTATAHAGCETGLYGVARGEVLAIQNSPPCSPEENTWYVFLDGRFGSLNGTDSPVRCNDGMVEVRQANGTFRVWEKIALRKTPTRFTSCRTELSGTLIEPVNAGGKPPLVVLVHGSEKRPMSASSIPYVLAAQGLMVFAYDKRGTGESRGDYTQDFNLLADDAAAAMVEARRLAAGRYSRAGFYGGSQGGWIAPLAATLCRADFVAVGFGLVLSPLEEDQEQVFSELRRKHYDDSVIARAREVTDATGAVIASHFTSGFEELARVKKRYAAEPWFAEIRGEFTGDVLVEDEAQLRRTGASRLDNLGIIWHYDAVAVLRSTSTPQLWVIAGDDREAPGDSTVQRLRALVRAGKPIDLYVFPNTDHGMTEFVEDADGTRHTTRVTEGYFRLVADWIKQEMKPPYGRGERFQRASRRD
jgi:pimeloyl-ACP methyl ester carboxylesterase